MGMMNILDRTGHTKLEWNKDVPFEVKLAKDAFDKAVKEGYNAFEVDEDGEKGKRVTKFDPEAEAILMVPQLVGG